MRFLLIKSFQIAGHLSYVPDKAIAAGGGWQERIETVFSGHEGILSGNDFNAILIPEAYFGTGAFTP